MYMTGYLTVLIPLINNSMLLANRLAKVWFQTWVSVIFTAKLVKQIHACNRPRQDISANCYNYFGKK